MDLATLLGQFGFPIVMALLLGKWLQTSLTDRINKLETANANSNKTIAELNKFIRENQEKTIKTTQQLVDRGHQREEVYVQIIRDEYTPQPQDLNQSVRKHP